MVLRILGDDERPPHPSWYQPADRIMEAGSIEVSRVALGQDDTAVLVRPYGMLTIVLVSTAVPETMTAAVAGHALRKHRGDLACSAATCPAQWPWLTVCAAATA